jgi:hypothetical protein
MAAAIVASMRSPVSSARWAARSRVPFWAARKTRSRRTGVPMTSSRNWRANGSLCRPTEGSRVSTISRNCRRTASTGGLAGLPLAHGAGGVAEVLLHGPEDQVLFGTEVVEDGHLGDVGRVGDLLHGHVVEAALGEEGDRGPDDPPRRLQLLALAQPHHFGHGFTVPRRNLIPDEILTRYINWLHGGCHDRDPAKNRLRRLPRHDRPGRPGHADRVRGDRADRPGPGPRPRHRQDPVAGQRVRAGVGRGAAALRQAVRRRTAPSASS